MNIYKVTIRTGSIEPYRVNVEAANVKEAIDTATRYYHATEETPILSARAIPVTEFRTRTYTQKLV